MLIEVKAKVKAIINNKTKIRTDTFLVNKEFFAEAEYKVTEMFEENITAGVVDSFDILSLKVSQIKEVYTSYVGELSYVVTLRDVFIDEGGNEKHLKYKILLWANDLSTANQRAHEITAQGYNMHIESIKETPIITLLEDEG